MKFFLKYSYLILLLLNVKLFAKEPNIIFLYNGGNIYDPIGVEINKPSEFNNYKHNDINFIVHIGDSIFEARNGFNVTSSDTVKIFCDSIYCLTFQPFGRRTIDYIDFSNCKSLKYLTLSRTRVEELDFSNNIELEQFIGPMSAEDHFKRIDFSKCTKLKYVSFGSLSFNSLDVSNCKLLEVLIISYTLIESLNLKNNNNLKQLLSQYNQKLSVLEFGKTDSLVEIDILTSMLESFKLKQAPNLKRLILHTNNIKYLDVSMFPKLEILDVTKNALLEIDISKNVSLKSINCSDNKIEKINVSHISNLVELNISKNAIKKLDISKNVSLQKLYCSENQLKEIDVSKCINLIDISCRENYLSSIDLKNNLNLKYFSCCMNNIKELDISNNKNLVRVYAFGNPLELLDISNNKFLQTESNIYLYNITTNEGVHIISNGLRLFEKEEKVSNEYKIFR